MIRIAPSDAAYDVIASALSEGSARWPMQRAGGQCFIQVEAGFVDRMRAMRRPGESYSSSPCRAWKRDAQLSGAEARELQAVEIAVRDAQYTAYLTAERDKTDKAIAESMALLAKFAAEREGRPRGGGA